MAGKNSLISLFSGAGGMDAGFQMADGFNLLLANDILYAPALTSFLAIITLTALFTRHPLLNILILGHPFPPDSCTHTNVGE